MKYCRLFIFFICLIFSFNTQADICAYTSEEIAQKARVLLEKQASVVDFCSTCLNGIPQITPIQTIDIKNILNSNDKQLYLNGNPRDLAHMFIYISEKEQYENLALIIKCPEAEKNKNLLLASFKDFESLKEKQNLCPENDRRCFKENARKRYLQIVELCRKMSANSQKTTLDMRKSAYDYISCISDELRKELSEILDTNYVQQAEEALEQIVKNSNLFYSILYSENRFCQPHCGTMATLFPPTETENILQQIYETTIILKLKKGY